LDCDTLIDYWYAVDDGSSEADLAAMKAIAPNVKWLDRTADEMGHVGSINTLLATAGAYDYFVWMEDDWFFIRDEHLITKAVQVLQVDDTVAQVSQEHAHLKQRWLWQLLCQ
jgi:GT2 family glycosyltransferase